MLVDVICNVTGEILKEEASLADAHIYIAKRNGKTIRNETEEEVQNLWVEIPEIQEDNRKLEENLKNAKKFWRY